MVGEWYPFKSEHYIIWSTALSWLGSGISRVFALWTTCGTVSVNLSHHQEVGRISRSGLLGRLATVLNIMIVRSQLYNMQYEGSSMYWKDLNSRMPREEARDIFQKNRMGSYRRCAFQRGTPTTEHWSRGAPTCDDVNIFITRCNPDTKEMKRGLHNVHHIPEIGYQLISAGGLFSQGWESRLSVTSRFLAEPVNEGRG